MRNIGHFIDGKEIPGKSGRHADVFNPNTGEVQAHVALASKAEVEAAIASAQAAQPGWAATNPQRRGEMRDHTRAAAIRRASARTGVTHDDG